MLVTINTYDVWGNEIDGYDINDIFKYGEFDFDYTTADDEQILDFLKGHYFNSSITLDDIDIDDDIDCIQISDAKNGRPVCEILPIR
jgi:hypothetical protein